MTDIVNQETRSRMMSRIRGKDTNPELIIRKGLFRRGFRYRIHCKHLPGNPDLVLKKYRTAIFVHGCFWHGHQCHLFKWPKTRADFWKNKILRTKIRDQDSLGSLAAGGWKCLVIWECSLKGKFRRQARDLLDEIEGWILGEEQYSEIASQEQRES